MQMKEILDWNEYLNMAREVVAEGCILLKNDNKALPLKTKEKVSVFGRIQNHYYKSGTGSGGMVNVSRVVSILDALKDCEQVILNEKLLEIYANWEAENPYEEGMGWGNEPWSQKEMPLSDEIVADAANESETAIVIIGRTAGEDQDVRVEKGSFLLTDLEMDMLKKVRANFEKVIVLLNVGGIMDMHFVDEIMPDAVMYVWQGGMNGGNGTCDVLTGKVNPSGRLTDTIAYEVSDYPSDKNFGDDSCNIYEEDIYVGYRYFETFAKDRVRYPFGFGLSYTQFEIRVMSTDVSYDQQLMNVEVEVKNIGDTAGKEVVQIYANPPQGVLGKPVRNLVDFKKTKIMEPGEKNVLSFAIPFSKMASYDDSGVTGHKSCMILEKGRYELYAGQNVASVMPAGEMVLDSEIIVEQLEEALAPVKAFSVMKPVAKNTAETGVNDVVEEENEDDMTNTSAYKASGDYEITMIPVATATVDMDERRKERIPEAIVRTEDRGIKLDDVRAGKATVFEFVAQLTDDELCSLVRGEGMGSSRVTAGTASAFAGVSKALSAKNVPAVCCDDGPSGMRFDCGKKAFSLPNGTMIASTFNEELVTKLYEFTSLEMVSNNVECLLGPGMNIHRHPLNGRNFEYFSEDPLVTGRMAGAILKGLHKYGVTGTIKHFCANNQERKRHFTDSVVSERALREIYLKGFEMAVKEAHASSVMTTYGSLNGLWTAGSYDLTTTILRKEWGFKGVVMTDWWAKISERGKEPDYTNFAAMVRAQNDMYMCCPNGETNESGDNTLEALHDGRLELSELQRTAVNVCEFAMNTQAMNRLLGEKLEVEIINREKDETDIDVDDVEYYKIEDELTVSLKDTPSVRNTNHIVALDASKPGHYKVSLTGKSNLGELAQIPCTLFANGIPECTFTFHGSDGKEVVLVGKARIYSRFAVMRLHVGGNGLELSEIKFEYQRPIEDGDFIGKTED